MVAMTELLQTYGDQAIELRDYQSQVIDDLRDGMRSGHRRQIISLPTGGGKCLAAGTMVLMADGSVRAVETILAGDALMGDDGTPRIVTSTAIGYGPMAEVRPVKGEPWRCNDDHILSLVRTGEPEPYNHNGEITDVSVRDWRGWSNWRRHIHKLYRQPVECFYREHGDLSVPPYLLGLLLGDGSLRHGSPSITTTDHEIVRAVMRLSHSMGCQVRRYASAGKPPSYYISTQRGKRNPLLDALRAMNLGGTGSGDKFVPDDYKLGSRDTRLSVLAGLMDTDGHMAHNFYDYLSKSRRLADDAAFMARSVGLAAYIAPKDVAGYGRYWRVSISGDISMIPCRIARKRPAERQQKKNALRTGFSVAPAGEDYYYGFTITGNGRFLLADFTVTHNTILAAHLLRETMQNGKRGMFVCDRLALVDQTSRVLRQYGLPHAVVQGQRLWSAADDYILVCSAQTLERRKWPESELIVVDEAHTVRKVTTEQIMGLEHGYAVGLTATPFTKGLGDIWSRVVTATTTNQLIDAGWLAPLKVYAAREIDMIGAKTNSAGEWQPGEVERRGTVIIGDIVTEWVEKTQEHFGGPAKTLVFSATVAHGESICDAFQNAGYDFRQVSYKDRDSDRRAEIIREFRHSDGRNGITGLVSVEALSKGFDVPDVKVIIGARPYRKSLSGHIQQIGRGMRPSPGKDYCLVLDHAGNFHGFFTETVDFFENGVDGLRKKLQKKSVTRREGAERADVACKQCNFVFQGRTCPSCGAQRPRRISGVRELLGRLDQVDLRSGAINVTREDRQTVWRSLCEVAASMTMTHDRGRKLALAQYRELFGDWPPQGWGYYPKGEPPVPGTESLVKRQLAAYKARMKKR